MEAVMQDNKQKLRRLGQQMKKLDIRLRDMCLDIHSLKTSLILERGEKNTTGCVSIDPPDTVAQVYQTGRDHHNPMRDPLTTTRACDVVWRRLS